MCVSITCCHFLILEVAELLGYPHERGCLLLVNRNYSTNRNIVESKLSSFRVHDEVGGGVAL